MSFQPLPLSPPPLFPSTPPTTTHSLPSTEHRSPQRGSTRYSTVMPPSSPELGSTSESSEGEMAGTGRRYTTANRRSTRSNGLRDSTASNRLDSTSIGVLTGSVGSSFGPFPRNTVYTPRASFLAHPSTSSEVFSPSPLPSTTSLLPHGGLGALRPNSYSHSRYSIASADTYGDLESHYDSGSGGERKVPDESLLWDRTKPEVDDYLHNPEDPEVERMLDGMWNRWSGRGVANVGALVVLITVLVGLFAGWPIYRFAIKGGFPDGTKSNLGWGPGGINGTGQVPNTSLPNLIDSSTPLSAYKRTGFDGETYNLVFSDEFEEDGRTFWPGDDPWWEAVDIHYWATTDLEWYDPDAVTTKDGKLVITLSEEPINGLNFRSGMLQSWNKLCFTGGYIEVNLSLPGTPYAQGYWPGVWTMGNLGRAGYGATNDGMWPYSYDSCDVGTLPNQTWPNGTSPTAAKTSGSHDYGGELSYLPGQRASACTCSGEDHPGPKNSVGRGAPEIDIIEGQVDYRGTGSASQSIQMAPMDAGYNWLNTTPHIQIWDTTKTFQNIWHGSVNQESMSVTTLTDKTSYEGQGWSTFGFEYDPGPSGRITWTMNGTQTWQLNADAMGPNADTGIAQRLVSMEPMSINLNLAISTKFQYPEWGKLVFPGHLLIESVRIYQKGTPNIGCNPPDFPTTDFINRHLDTYMNANLTTWLSNENNTWPKNSLGAKGC